MAIEADRKAFQFYRRGVFHSASCGTTLDHGVLIVGYGTDTTTSPPLDYWIVKNSWGTSWGEGGYIRIARGHPEGQNDGVCGIELSADYPFLIEKTNPDTYYHTIIRYYQILPRT